MTTYKFRLIGTAPLLMHSNNIEARDQLEDIRKKTKGKPGDDRSPPETWKTYLYVSEQSGNVCMPYENLLSMLLAGGSAIKVAGKETLKAYSQFIQFSEIEYDLLVGGKTIPTAKIDAIKGEFREHADAARGLGFHLSVKPCTVGTSSHVRVRPMFRNWSIEGAFEVDDEDRHALNLSSLQSLWTSCGRRVGLGDWRPKSPKKPGQYGRFTAEISKA